MAFQAERIYLQTLFKPFGTLFKPIVLNRRLASSKIAACCGKIKPSFWTSLPSHDINDRIYNMSGNGLLRLHLPAQDKNNEP